MMAFDLSKNKKEKVQSDESTNYRILVGLRMPLRPHHTQVIMFSVFVMKVEPVIKPCIIEVLQFEEGRLATVVRS